MKILCTVFPHIVSALEQFTQQKFSLLSKKLKLFEFSEISKFKKINSFRRNYMGKYGFQKNIDSIVQWQRAVSRNVMHEKIYQKWTFLTSSHTTPHLVITSKTCSYIPATKYT